MFRKPDSYKNVNSSEYIINNNKKDNDIINNIIELIKSVKNLCFSSK